MNLKQLVLGLGILGTGFPLSYAYWKYFPADTNIERDLAKPLVTLAIGLTTAIAGGKLIGKNLRDNLTSTNPNNPNYQSTPQNTPKKRKYVERRIDEYGRESRIEREETIE